MDITLDKPHTHAGKVCAAGDIVTVNPIVGEWLKLREVGHETTQAEKAAKDQAAAGTEQADSHSDVAAEAEIPVTFDYNH